MTYATFKDLLGGIKDLKSYPIQERNKLCLEEIHRTFPVLTECHNAGPCVRALYMRYVISLAKLKDVSHDMYDIINLLYSNINTVSAIYTELNNHARAFGGEAAYNVSVAVFKRTDVQSRDVRSHAQTVVSDKNRSQKQIELTHVLGVISAYKSIDGNDASSRSKRAIALLLSVGSRLIELLKVSNYEAIENKPNQIRVSNFAKKRGLVAGSIDKPLLGLTSQEFLDGVTFIRSFIDKKQGNAKVTSLWDAKLNQEVRATRGLEQCSVKDLRAIYANAAFKLHAPKSGPDVPSSTAYISQVLGHDQRSLTTALSYQGINIRMPIQHENTLDSTDVSYMKLQSDIDVVKDDINVIKGLLEKRIGDVDWNTRGSQGEESNTAMFITKDNTIVNINKMPKSRNLDYFQKTLRVQIGKKILIKHNVQVSNAKLRLLGVWNLTVNEHNKHGEGGEGGEAGEEGT